MAEARRQERLPSSPGEGWWRECWEGGGGRQRGQGAHRDAGARWQVIRQTDLQVFLLAWVPGPTPASLGSMFTETQSSGAIFL